MSDEDEHYNFMESEAETTSCNANLSDVSSVLSTTNYNSPGRVKPIPAQSNDLISQLHAELHIKQQQFQELIQMFHQSSLESMGLKDGSLQLCQFQKKVNSSLQAFDEFMSLSLDGIKVLQIDLKSTQEQLKQEMTASRSLKDLLHSLQSLKEQLPQVVSRQQKDNQAMGLPKQGRSGSAMRQEGQGAEKLNRSQDSQKHQRSNSMSSGVASQQTMADLAAQNNQLKGQLEKLNNEMSILKKQATLPSKYVKTITQDKFQINEDDLKGQVNQLSALLKDCNASSQAQLTIKKHFKSSTKLEQMLRLRQYPQMLLTSISALVSLIHYSQGQQNNDLQKQAVEDRPLQINSLLTSLAMNPPRGKSGKSSQLALYLDNQNFASEQKHLREISNIDKEERSVHTPDFIDCSSFMSKERAPQPSTPPKVHIQGPNDITNSKGGSAKKRNLAVMPIDQNQQYIVSNNNQLKPPAIQHSANKRKAVFNTRSTFFIGDKQVQNTVTETKALKIKKKYPDNVETGSPARQRIQPIKSYRSTQKPSTSSSFAVGENYKTPSKKSNSRVQSRTKVIDYESYKKVNESSHQVTQRSSQQSDKRMTQDNKSPLKLYQVDVPFKEYRPLKESRASRSPTSRNFSTAGKLSTNSTAKKGHMSVDRNFSGPQSCLNSQRSQEKSKLPVQLNKSVLSGRRNSHQRQGFLLNLQKQQSSHKSSAQNREERA